MYFEGQFIFLHVLTPNLLIIEDVELIKCQETTHLRDHSACQEIYLEYPRYLLY
jgi:hypothetical protein